MTCLTRLEELERACRRPVTIQYDESLADCNQQFQSPLFSELPREIRDLIWAYATAPVEEETQKYNANEYYCRPGHRARHKTYTDLLYTCRKIWLEANAMPMLHAEHCFWYHRAAPDARSPEWMANLTKMNRENFGCLHMFCQMFAIESLSDGKNGLRQYVLKTREQPGDFQPRMLHVTIRHTDWWNWESEQPLRFEDRWFKAMLDSPDLRSTQTLKLELETLDYKVDQMMPIVERLQRLESQEFQTHLVDGVPKMTKFVLTGEPEVYTWSGPTDINGHRFSQYSGKNALNYHIVTLTWRLVFPEIPRAHIPKLRRAPRIGAYKATRASRTYNDEQYHEQTFPARPSEPSHYTKPSRSKRKVRRGTAGMTPREKGDRQVLFAALETRSHVLGVQEWQDDVRIIGEGNRFRSAMVAERISHREEGAEAEMKRVEARWREEESLLSFA